MWSEDSTKDEYLRETLLKYVYLVFQKLKNKVFYLKSHYVYFTTILKTIKYWTVSALIIANTVQFTPLTRHWTCGSLARQCSNVFLVMYQVLPKQQTTLWHIILSQLALAQDSANQFRPDPFCVYSHLSQIFENWCLDSLAYS